MNIFSKKIHRLTIAGSLLVFTSANLAFTQPQSRPPRKVIQPVNLVYDSVLDGVSASVQEAYIHSTDGLYIPAVILKPPGKGPFPAVVAIHGSPGGRGMSELKSIVQTRGMATDRFVKEGYVTLYCDYRRTPVEGQDGPKDLSYAADVVSVIRFAKQLPGVDPNKVCLYSGSLGSESTVLALGEESVAAAVINAPGGFTYMKVSRDNSKTGLTAKGLLPDDRFNKKLALENLGKINTPILFVVGTADRFLPNVKTTVSVLNDLGKDASIDLHPDEKHGFYWGPNKKEGKYEPTPAFGKALDKAITFFEARVK